MKIGIIDVGSNSVRLAIIENGKTLYKALDTTRLGEGLAISGKISKAASERTIFAIANFKTKALAQGANEVYVFATAAVRSATNREEFLNSAKSQNITIDVIDGEKEAQIGLLGAIGTKDGGIIDVGGASTEVSYQVGGRLVYSKSVDIGTVRLFDLCGRDKQKLQAVIDKKLLSYGSFVPPHTATVYAIGGTASRLGALIHNLNEYVPEVTNGTQVSLQDLKNHAENLLTLPVETIKQNAVCKDAADIVGGGCLLLYSVAKHFKLEKIIISESDNLEGYYKQLTIKN